MSDATPPAAASACWSRDAARTCRHSSTPSPTAASTRTIAVVISNVAGAPALARAEQAGIETLVIPHTGWPSREAFDERLADALVGRDVRLVCLAGFMRRLSARLPRALHRAGTERPPVAAAGVPRDRRRGPGAGARREGGRLHRAPRDARTRRRADRAAGGRAGAGRRYRGDAGRADPGRGAPAAPGRRGLRARRPLALDGRRFVASSISEPPARSEREPDAERARVRRVPHGRGRETAPHLDAEIGDAESGAGSATRPVAPAASATRSSREPVATDTSTGAGTGLEVHVDRRAPAGGEQQPGRAIAARPHTAGSG